jgi:Peroxiredoxin
MKRISAVLIIALLLLTSCSSSSPAAQTKAPDFALKNIDGRYVSLSDYKGKIVVLNFFGVWCPWCKKEMPGFVKVYNEYKDKGVELLVVDVGDTRDVLMDYLKQNNFDIKPVLDSSDRVSQLYKVNSYPTSFFIDKDGTIRGTHAGYMDEATLRKTLNSLIK